MHRDTEIAFAEAAIRAADRVKNRAALASKAEAQAVLDEALPPSAMPDPPEWLEDEEEYEILPFTDLDFEDGDYYSDEDDSSKEME